MTLLTLSMSYVDLSGNPYSGQVVFQPTSSLLDTGHGTSIGISGVTVALNGSGAGSVQLPHTDDPSITTGSPALATWCFRVVEQVVSPGGLLEARQPYYIDLPVALGASAVLANLPRFGNRPGYGFLYGIW